MANPRIHFLTFGDGTPQIRGAAWRLARQARRAGIFSGIDRYDLRRLRTDYPAFWDAHAPFLLRHKRGLGYFLWKPFLIAAKLHEFPAEDFLLYSDAGCDIDARHGARMLDQLPYEPFDLSAVPLESIHPVKRWTNGYCLRSFAGAEAFADEPQFGATFLFLRNTARSRAFADEWLRRMIADDYGCLIDRAEDEAPYFQQHRWDQSILTLLIYEACARGALSLRTLPIEEARRPPQGIHGNRNLTPFTSVGPLRRVRRPLSKVFSASVKLRRALRQCWPSASTGALPP